MSNSSFRILPGLLVTIATALIMPTVHGQAPIPTPTPVVVFTEKSSTDLTAVYTNGMGVSTNLTVIFDPSFPDSWEVETDPTVLLPTLGIGAGWFEPSSTSSGNGIGSGVNEWFVGSDEPFVPGAMAFANNTQTSYAIASDVTGGGSVPVYGIFNDLGDRPAGVPDTGTTASLLGFSLAGLAFLRRKLS